MIVDLTDREVLRRFLRGDPALHLYELGDLDPAFWPACRWHGWQVDGALRPAVQALSFQVWRSLARAENLRRNQVFLYPDEGTDRISRLTVNTTILRQANDEIFEAFEAALKAA